MCNINIDLLIQNKSWKKQKDINLNLMEDTFKAVYNHLKVPICKRNIEVSITLSDDKNIRVLNKEYC